jgi:hypothetical protein
LLRFAVDATARLHPRKRRPRNKGLGVKLRGFAVLASIAFACALTGCGGNSNSTPAPPATLSNVTGDYVGTLTDATAGTQAASATLSEHGSAVGGALLLGAAGATSIALALTLTTSNALSGSGTMDTTGTACTFTLAATYDPNANTLTGTYTPVGTCTQMTGGTYSLTQQCMDAPSSDRRRPKELLPHC